MGITFGTSGWRAIIADEFTLANVRLVTYNWPEGNERFHAAAA